MLGVTFLTLLVIAGVRAAPGVFIRPLELELGWDRASISLAASIGILVLGIGGPLSGILIDRFGPRVAAFGSSALLVGGLAALLPMREVWQPHLFWGVVVGLGTGGTAHVLGASVAHRWFQSHRGLVVGLLGAAGSGGQVLFLPPLIALTGAHGWRAAILLLVAASTLLIVPLWLFLRDRPADLGVRAVGELPDAPAAAAEEQPRVSLRQAVQTRDFWLLAGSFAMCGYTANGLTGTHLIPHTVEHGFSEEVVASTVAPMGAVNVVGTLASGWLTDRYDNRVLLALFYGFRALSITALPFIIDTPGLLLFAVVYGLDWAATFPPTTNLTAKLFGRASLGTVFAWIFFAHMVGAAVAAYAGGFFRDVLGDYHLVFLSAALIGLLAVAMSLSLRPAGQADAARPAR